MLSYHRVFPSYFIDLYSVDYLSDMSAACGIWYDV